MIVRCGFYCIFCINIVPPVYCILCIIFIAFSALFLRLSDSQHMKKRQGCMPWRVAPQVRLELTTLRLTAECSAIELLRIIRGLSCGLLPARRSALSASGTFTLGFGARPGFAHHFWLALRLGSCLGFATCSAVSPGFRSPPRSPLCFGSGKNFRSSRSSWIPATSYSPKPFPAQYHQRLEA